jgi:hypothetical protein
MLRLRILLHEDLKPSLRTISDPERVFDNIESKVDFVTETLVSWERPWLMVFNNYDNPDTVINVSDYIPQGETGSILFTSRNADSRRLGTTTVRLTRMTENESLELLLRHSQHDRMTKTGQKGVKIVERLYPLLSYPRLHLLVGL